MKRTTTAMAMVLLFCLSAQARPVRWWSPKDLCDKADLVVLATVRAVEKTDEAGVIQLGNNPAYPVVMHKAKLTVNYAIKGESPKQIEFRYSPLDNAKVGPIANGPGRISLEKGATYVFYPKRVAKEGQTFYVGVLEGEFDDQQAVVLVAPPAAEGGAK